MQTTDASSPASAGEGVVSDMVVVSSDVVEALRVALERQDAQPHHYHCGEVVRTARKLYQQVTT